VARRVRGNPDALPASRSVDPADLVARGRDAQARRAWDEAYELLVTADGAAELAAEDLEDLATVAFMLGRENDVRLLERAHHAHLATGEEIRAARCAFWIGITLADRGALGPASGWLARSERLLANRDCVEQGYLLVPLLLRQSASGELEAAHATALAAAEIAERFDDADLLALAVMSEGRVLLEQGRVEEGLARLDEAMVSVTADELSPHVTGLIYCSLIAGCHEVYDLRRAHEWTAALVSWCEEQPGLYVYTGECLVHRAEVLQHQGAWRDAREEAERARRRFAARPGSSRRASAQAAYRQGELHRLLGEPAAAEAAFREANELGWEPQPGLSLLRLAQGDVAAAAAAIRRAVVETAEPLKRAGLLPAYVEIMLAEGQLEEARRACRELEECAAPVGSDMLSAVVAQARGAVALADGDASAALTESRRADRIWQELAAPYESARTRVLVGLACRQLGDEDAGERELEAARRVFHELGAAPDLARTEQLSRRTASRPTGGLTARELEVVRLVATGRTNKAIADELVISEKTVARHVSNIFTKLRISSRSALTAHAYEHGLV
jgi:DNA-binding CsgD family transcriptional regulator